MSDRASKQNDPPSSGSEQFLLEAKLVLGENSAHNRHPVVRINGAHPCVSRMIDPMLFEVVVKHPMKGPVTVALDSPYLDSEIRYTLNGNSPTNKSLLHIEPLMFTRNVTSDHTTVKARIYRRVNSNLKGRIIRVAFNVLPLI